jgi:hypothetical protein
MMSDPQYPLRVMSRRDGSLANVALSLKADIPSGLGYVSEANNGHRHLFDDFVRAGE